MARKPVNQTKNISTVAPRKQAAAPARQSGSSSARAKVPAAMNAVPDKPSIEQEVVTPKVEIQPEAAVTELPEAPVIEAPAIEAKVPAKATKPQPETSPITKSVKTVRVAKPKAVAKPEVSAAPLVKAPRKALAKRAVAAPPKPSSAKTSVTSSIVRKPTLISKKGLSEMATTTAASAEKIKSAFTDFNGRAKAAFEKTAKLGEEFTDLTKGNLEAVAESAKIAAKGAESLAQEAADYSKRSFESATAAMKRYSAIKSPAELIQLNSEYAKTSFDSAVAEVSKMSEAMTKLAGDFFQPLSSRYSIAAEKLKASAF